jgi:hypothetical protein
MTRTLTPLDLRYIDGDTWLLIAPFAADSSVLGGVIVVEAHTTTDFNSVPRVLQNILPPTEYGESGVLHDALYRRGQWNGQPVTRAIADQVHREFLIWKQAPAWKVHAMYAGLRAFGWLTWNRYRQAAAPPVATP